MKFKLLPVLFIFSFLLLTTACDENLKNLNNQTSGDGELIGKMDRMTQLMQDQQSLLNEMKQQNQSLQSRLKQLENQAEVRALAQPAIDATAAQKSDSMERISKKELKMQRQKGVSKFKRTMSANVSKIHKQLNLSGPKAKKMLSIGNDMVRQLAELYEKSEDKDLGPKKQIILSKIDRQIKATLSAGEYRKYSEIVRKMRK